MKCALAELVPTYKQPTKETVQESWRYTHQNDTVKRMDFVAMELY